MGNETWIVIPRWDEFQHRDMARSTVPPWIKNHTKLLHDENYLGLSVCRRALLHGLWLEYASARRQLDFSVSSINHRLRLHAKISDFEALQKAGFIKLSASRPASDYASNHASLEVEVDKRRGLSRTLGANPRVVDRLRKAIRNGAITDNITLEAELRAHGLNGDDEKSLKAELEAATCTPAVDRDIPF